MLLEPSKPIITPSAVTTATERKPLNLTCSSVGGSPPPQIKWYSLGNDQQLDATIIRGKNKDEPTKSILSITPTRKDDGASYRCTVWNRALRQQQNLHSDTKLFVNCKYKSVTIFLHLKTYKIAFLTIFQDLKWFLFFRFSKSYSRTIQSSQSKSRRDCKIWVFSWR